MPLYEYECKKCGHRFEKIQKFSDRMVKKCPECGGVVEQMISAPAVQFKGSGWYVTDYAKKSSAPSASSSEGGKSEGGSKDKDKDSKETKKDEKKSESSASSSSASSSKEAKKADKQK
jgi:putative FmdB family regulatory protein